MKYKIFSLVFLLFACGIDEPEQFTSEWSIPIAEVFDGGPGKDGIPSIDNPNFSIPEDAAFLGDDDLVIGMVHNGIAKAYPHSILDWHEIVNDEIADIQFGLTYCPLTGTGIAWDRKINGEVTTFGVSGKLYNTNLMPFDRKTDSYWSQMRLDCVNGELLGVEISTFNAIETSWSTWKKAYPETLVLNTNTGFDRDYNDYPYGDYRTNNANIIFPISNDDNRLPAKERVLGLVSGETKKAYSLELFEGGRVIEDVIDGENVVLIGSKEDNFAIAIANPSIKNITFVEDELPVIAEGENGNRITISGYIESGSLANTQLEIRESYIGYFFSFGTFHEGIEIYE